MADRAGVGSPIFVNTSGGLYEVGRLYSYSKKWEVAAVFFRLWEENWLVKPSMSSLSKRAGVTDKWAKRVVDELTTTTGLSSKIWTSQNTTKTYHVASVLISHLKRKCFFSLFELTVHIVQTQNTLQN
jgi:hypothetical protein